MSSAELISDLDKFCSDIPTGHLLQIGQPQRDAYIEQCAGRVELIRILKTLARRE